MLNAQIVWCASWSSLQFQTFDKVYATTQRPGASQTIIMCYTTRFQVLRFGMLRNGRPGLVTRMVVTLLQWRSVAAQKY